MPSGVLSRRTFPSLKAIVASLPKSRFFPLIVAALSVLLASPSMRAGLIIDDYYHRAILHQGSPYRELLGPPAAMFRFFTGDPVRTRRIMDLGAFPWWTDPTLKGEFLQAITVLTHRLDYALWPDSPALMHAQSLFWLGTAVAAVAVFYRRMLGATWVAAVAALLYAVDDARGATVSFIANRNVLIAATFGVSALVCHDRWRRGGSRPAAVLAVILLALALFSKEEGIGTCAYLAAYALFADPTGRKRGCLAMIPYLGVVVGWRALRDAWGYGVHNLGLYVDPLTDPGVFAAAVAERVPLILFGQWGPIPAESVVALRPSWSNVFWWAAVLLTGLLFFAVGPLLKRDRLARFWGAGMCLATIPVCATFAMDRLLTFVGIGAFGLLAQFWAFIRRLGQCSLEPLVANPGAGSGLVSRGRARGLDTARSSLARKQPHGPLVGRKPTVRQRTAGSGYRRKNPGHRECTEPCACGLPRVPSGGHWQARPAPYACPRAGHSGRAHSPARRAHARNQAQAGLSRSGPGQGFPYRAPAAGNW